MLPRELLLFERSEALPHSKELFALLTLRIDLFCARGEAPPYSAKDLFALFTRLIDFFDDGAIGRTIEGCDFADEAWEDAFGLTAQNVIDLRCSCPGWMSTLPRTARVLNTLGSVAQGASCDSVRDDSTSTPAAASGEVPDCSSWVSIHFFEVAPP